MGSLIWPSLVVDTERVHYLLQELLQKNRAQSIGKHDFGIRNAVAVMGKPISSLEQNLEKMRKIPQAG